MGVENTYNPIALLRHATRAVPAVRYATGLVGIAAAAIIIRALVGDVPVASMLLVAGVMILAMAMLVIFAASADAPKKRRSAVGMAFLWAACLFTIFFMSITVTAVTFGWPKGWAHTILPTQAVEEPLAELATKDGPNAPQGSEVADIATASPATADNVQAHEPSGEKIVTRPKGLIAPQIINSARPSVELRPNRQIIIENRSGRDLIDLRTAGGASPEWGPEILKAEATRDPSGTIWQRLVRHNDSLTRDFVPPDGGCMLDFQVILQGGLKREARGVNVCEASSLIVHHDRIEVVAGNK